MSVGEAVSSCSRIFVFLFLYCCIAEFEAQSNSRLLLNSSYLCLTVSFTIVIATVFPEGMYVSYSGMISF